MPNVATMVFSTRVFVIVLQNTVAPNVKQEVILFIIFSILKIKQFKGGSKIRDDPRDMCDNIFNKLDLLANISPENYPGDDFLFSRFNESTIGAGDKATYGNKPKTWISPKPQYLI